MRSVAVRVREGRTRRRDSGRGTSACAVRDAIASSSVPGAMITACIQRWTRSSATSGAIRLQLLTSRDLLLRLQNLGVHDLEGGYVLVPFHERGDTPGAPIRAAIERPHLVDDMVAVGVDDV